MRGAGRCEISRRARSEGVILMRIFAVALIAGVVLSSFAAHAAPAKRRHPLEAQTLNVSAGNTKPARVTGEIWGGLLASVLPIAVAFAGSRGPRQYISATSASRRSIFNR